MAGVDLLSRADDGLRAGAAGPHHAQRGTVFGQARIDRDLAADEKPVMVNRRGDAEHQVVNLLGIKPGARQAGLHHVHAQGRQWHLAQTLAEVAERGARTGAQDGVGQSHGFGCRGSGRGGFWESIRSNYSQTLLVYKTDDC